MRIWARLLSAAAGLIAAATWSSSAQGGACCLPGGDCIPAGSDAECGGFGGILLAQADCATDPCAVGACCFEQSCNMADAYACIAAGRDYIGAGTSCLDDPCAAGAGACCFEDGVPCAQLLPADCAAAEGQWLGGGTSCALCPAFGACCLGQKACSQETQAVCEKKGLTWLGPGTSCDDCPASLVCDPGVTLAGQNPDGPGDFLAGTSEVSTGLIRSEDFTGATGAIQSLTWWGLDLQFIPPGTWIECVESDPTFQIALSPDAAGAPGPPLRTYTLAATRTPLGILYLGAELNEYTVTLPEPCVLVNGWLSIAGLGDPDCLFLWMSAGLGSSWCQGCSPEPQGNDYAFCLEGQSGGIFGACCADAEGTCQEEVEITRCADPSLRFAPGAACADLEPPCGVILGACCFGDATCAVDTAEDCAAAGGSWLGANSLCAQCPCIAFCPPGGFEEGEPVCHDEYQDDFNAGCDALPPVFSPIAPGQTICARSGVFLDGGAADFDWYQAEVGSGPSLITLIWSVVAEFPVAVWVLDGTSGCPGTILASDIAGECAPIEIVTDSGQGTFWIVVAPAAFTDSSACGAGYTVSLTMIAPCPADVDGSGAVDVADLVAVILAWGSADPGADVNDDGLVDVADLVAVILAWGACG
jgi:hypothetical protein